MSWIDTLKTLAPTVAAAALGPAGAGVVAAVGSILGMSQPTQDSIAKVFSDGQLTADHLAEIRKLELQYQNDEKERGFRYTELAFKDVEGARQMQIATKSTTPTVLSYGVLLAGGAMMASVLYGYAKVDSVLAGTLVGYAVSEMKAVLQYWFGTSQGSQEKTNLLAQSQPVK